GWLYRVALRAAWRLRTSDMRRTARESHAAARPAADPMDEITWRELRQVLDEELQRLPEKFRAPLLLCYLEGRSRDEAACQLGWTVGMVKGRLERGRLMLRDRLARRGLTLGA